MNALLVAKLSVAGKLVDVSELTTLSGPFFTSGGRLFPPDRRVQCITYDMYIYVYVCVCLRGRTSFFFSVSALINGAEKIRHVTS